MELCQVTVALIGTLSSLLLSSAADLHHHHQHFEPFDAHHELDNAWHMDVPFKSDSSQLLPHYTGIPYDTLKHGTEPVPAYKKLRSEDKAFKKYDDHPHLKDMMAIKSGSTTNCHEISVKDSATNARMDAVDDSKRDKIKCYRCKDPKSGSTYEHCSYSSRPSRSNAAAERTLDSLTAGSESRKEKKRKPTPASEYLPENFKFSDDYFSPEATDELPAEYDKDAADNCKKVVRNSMVCMVCRDPKTKGKYEQCSYVPNPNEKAYAYTKSSSFGNQPESQPSKQQQKKKSKKSEEVKLPAKPYDDEEEEEDPNHEAEARQPYRYDEPEEYTGGSSDESKSGSGEDKEGHGSHYVPHHDYSYPSYYGSYEGASGDDGGSEAQNQNAADSGSCRTVEKNGESCQVCKDPKTGGESERCNYAYEPKDKAYAYTKSKSFGYPESSDSNDEGDKSAEASNQEAAASGEEYDGVPTSAQDYVLSESEKVSAKVKKQGDCRKEKRDGGSMVCTICKDARTGGDNERCEYAYEPDDKVYAYSKSKHVGSPTKYGGGDDDEATSDEEKPEESTYGLPAIYPTGTSPLDYIPKAKKSDKLSKKQTGNDSIAGSKVDDGFQSASQRRAEIEQVVHGIDAVDRSGCGKTYRGGMTCYRCRDNATGSTSEECVYVTDGDDDKAGSKKEVAASSPVEVTVRPSLKLTLNTAKPTTTTTTTSTTSTTTTTTAKPLVELLAKNVRRRKVRDTEEQEAKDADEQLEVLDEEKDEAEPYDYVAETRPVYDKVLGMTLPAYMVLRSKHEVEFDDIVENSKD